MDRASLFRSAGPLAIAAFCAGCMPDIKADRFEDVVGCYANDARQRVLEVRANHELTDPAGRRLAAANLDIQDKTSWLKLEPGLKWSVAQRALVPTGESSEIHFVLKMGEERTIGLIPVEKDQAPLSLIRVPC